MKRLLLGVIAAVIMVSGGATASADVNDFNIFRYDIAYKLSKDQDGRSRLETTETITADFPDYDQNHGIERAVPTKYDGHPTSLKIQSVTKPDGSEWEYSTSSNNGNEIIRIGDADEYVKGRQTFIVQYVQRDVTKAFNNTGSDEFYWDTNGTDWRVPIDRLNVTLAVDNELKSSLTGNNACYQGGADSAATCRLVDDDGTFTTFASNLNAGENITMAMGFKPGTFNRYEKSVWETVKEIWLASIVITFAVSVIVTMLLIIRWYSWTNRTKELGTIIAEYIPPANTSITTAASILSTPASVFTAQLLDFAVRHYIKIIQTREKSFWKTAEYDIEIIKDISSLKAEEQEILTDIFNGTTAVGTKLALKELQKDTSLYKRTKDNDTKLKELVRGEYGLRKKIPEQSRWFRNVSIVLLVLSIVTLNPSFFIASMVGFALGTTLWPLTDKGLELRRYLDGLKQYIKVAEAERLKMLQSPEGALKVPTVDTADSAQLVKLYERVLPYAVLFGQEKEWAKRIGDIYESNGSSPSWYAGNTAAFNAVIFSSAVSGFNTAASYSAASSSSSGGSGGGGSSGGGGGGGGGGGW